ncbi:metallopeptidase family protein [Tindallia californiensis]|uniref:Predicted Zn-dependent protease, minimal metalloprotease (MMP)-like domain n=1 Tax=Tindallia californiensis TaxID=159292 RepID=A0A1H3M8N6_9FIRM|nr:metallopeptidase family protein [Tindallia californiensis]SDY72936.1 Predicted Zn-dependent protease, minimal metalloprotease (MMP)-like domain [Tindallia californiensis]
MSKFPSIDTFHEMLNQISDEIPQDFFKELHGGVVLLERSKKHVHSKPGKPLYVMGQYRRDQMGRQIVIYYGSFRQVYRGLSEKRLYLKVKDVLLHEFTHHLESLAGERGLEKEDEEKMRHYLR